MQQAQNNDTVIVCFEGRTMEGELFDCATPANPLRFTIGDEGVLNAFSAAVIGMRPGEKKCIVVQPGDGFGERQEDLVVTVDRSSFPEDFAPRVGIVVGMNLHHNDADHQVPAMITAVDGDRITVDYNHPLAGQILSYAITLQEIVDSASS